MRMYCVWLHQCIYIYRRGFMLYLLCRYSLFFIWHRILVREENDMYSLRYLFTWQTTTKPKTLSNHGKCFGLYHSFLANISVRSNAYDELHKVVFLLHNKDITTYIYNAQLCVFPEVSRPFTKQSISEWKDMFLPICEGCSLQGQCGRFFSTNNNISMYIHKIECANSCA